MEKQQKKKSDANLLSVLPDCERSELSSVKIPLLLILTKFSTSINVQIAQHFKPAGNMTHP